MSTSRAQGRTHGVGLTRHMGIGLCAVMACGDPPSGSADSGTGSTTAAEATTASDETASTGTATAGWEPSLDVGEEVGAFFSVWGPSPDVVYAVASQPLDGGLSHGALMLWDGTQWVDQPLPEDAPGLNWVFGVGSRRFMAGEFGRILVRDGDEGEWTPYDCGTILPMWGIWGSDPDDVWVVGGDGFNRDPFACHFDGTAWTKTDFESTAAESHALFKVWGTASDDVWAVGHEGLLMHWTGEADGWTEIASGTTFDLISVWGTGPEEILAVGGRAEAVVLRYDGTRWSMQQDPTVPGLNGVWMAADGTATVVGPQGRAGVVAPGSLMVQTEDSGTPLALHGVFGFDGVERWAVGGSLDMSPPFVGVAIRRQP
ncbi:MAG: hypothetical protein K0V04_24360 [Deltaproteobacteria bacterium]|nr:hypothetical protein [Deltaproteobacteria bacterium]